MKLGGKQLSALVEEYVVIPRPEGDLVFTFRPLKDNEEFLKLCPVPQPPSITMAGETQSRPDMEDAGYKAAVTKHNRLFTSYLVISSMLATPGLEFDTVKISDPETWLNFEKELEAAHFLKAEIQKFYEAAFTVNGMSDAAYEAARQRFLASKRRTALRG